VRDSITPLKRWAQVGERPKVTNMDSISVVLLAAQKLVCRTDEALGLAIRASTVFEATCEIVKD
jgi:hypothetical protein